ncbi:MAG: hypothetical protein R3A78_09535 [Polyangiales bacterium]
MRNRLFFVLGGSAVLAALGGCGGASTEGGLGGSQGKSISDICSLSGSNVQQVDVNGDGKPDVRHAMNGGKRLCSSYDMNFDGKVDVRRLYEADGTTPKQEEHDFDFDGKVDQMSFYSNGNLVRKELDTNFDNQVDTWIWCTDGLIAKSERARARKGTDLWEKYDQGLLTEMAYDDNHDGKAEKWEHFDKGRLVDTAYDSNKDGKADKTIPAAAKDAPLDEPISCDGREMKLPAAAPAASTDAAAATSEESSAAGEGADSAANPTDSASSANGTTTTEKK